MKNFDVSEITDLSVSYRDAGAKTWYWTLGKMERTMAKEVREASVPSRASLSALSIYTGFD